MPTTVSQGRLFRVTSEVSDARLRAMKNAPQAAADALRAGADYWHGGVLPRHFDKDAHGRYGYARRSKNYLLNRNKGTKPDLVLSGSLRRDLKSRAAFAQGSNFVELRMSARVLNLVPRIAENDPDLYVKHRNGHGYPNLKREIKAITPEERSAVAAVTNDELARKFETEKP